MNVSITFRHMDHTPTLDQTIREKSEKFKKWFSNITTVHWTCWVDGTDHCSEVTLHAGPQAYFAKAHADDLYKTFDLIVTKIKNQLE